MKLDGMVDVSDKKPTRRIATSQAVIKLSPSTLDLVKNGEISKGDVLEVARVAGIMAAKETPAIIPLCHPLQLSHVKISFSFFDDGITITSRVSAIEKTGVEMESLLACAVSALTIYDMCKMYDKAMEITDIKLLEKKKSKI
jgi:cyclic pyranopterin phosphate synthase